MNTSGDLHLMFAEYVGRLFARISMLKHGGVKSSKRHRHRVNNLNIMYFFPLSTPLSSLCIGKKKNLWGSTHTDSILHFLHSLVRGIIINISKNTRTHTWWQKKERKMQGKNNLILSLWYRLFNLKQVRALEEDVILCLTGKKNRGSEKDQQLLYKAHTRLQMCPFKKENIMQHY